MKVTLEPFEKIKKEFAWSQYIEFTDNIREDSGRVYPEWNFHPVSTGIYTLQGKLDDISGNTYSPIIVEVEFSIQEQKKLSPKQQMKTGILPSAVECNEGLELIFKSSDIYPACVKPLTAEKLIERGWASP